MSLIETTIEDRVAVITLNDPGRRNAMSQAMSSSLGSTLEYLKTSPEVGALVITGTPPAFSAGADLDELEASDEEILRRIYDGFLAVARFPRPTIAAVNGPAVGAGLNLALACDLRVAAAGARFECRFLDIALHPGGGHSWMLRELVGPQTAAAMLLCNQALDGPASVARGLAWSCVGDDELMAEAVQLARKAARAPERTVIRIKDTLRAMAGIGTHELAVERELEAQLWSTRQEEFTERLAALKKKISRSSAE